MLTDTCVCVCVRVHVRTAAGHSALVGFALDGRGMYGEFETSQTPAVLDSCNGHIGNVPAYTDTGQAGAGRGRQGQAGAGRAGRGMQGQAGAGWGRQGQAGAGRGRQG